MLSKRIFIAFALVLLFAGTANAATYYVKNGGSNLADGLSDATAWETVGKVASFSFATGDDVYFKCGDTFAPSAYLNIDWEGTSSNPAVIGAYYMDGATETVGVSGDRPVISGSDYTVPTNDHFTALSTQWKGLIQVTNKDYVHIKDLHILKSGFGGVRIEGDVDAGTSSTHFLVKNVVIEGAYHAGIVSTENAYNYGIIEDCDVSGTSYGWYVGGMPSWPNGIATSHCPYAYQIVRNNYVYENWGEGIGFFGSGRAENVSHITIEDNTIWNNRRADIYIDSVSHNIIRRNLCLGGGGSVVGSTYTSKYDDGRHWNSSGIAVSNENYNDWLSNGNHNQIYNNLIAGHYVGIYFSTESLEGSMTDVVFYNNTVIGNARNLSIGSKLANFTTSGVEFKNNIFMVASDGYATSPDGVAGDSSWVPSKITFDYNAWSVAPTYLSGANDIIIDNNFAKTTGWQSLTAVIAATEFQLTAGSNAIDAGTTLAAVTDDYWENARGSSYDIGAHEYGSDTAAPAVTGISPQSGSILGGPEVTITGTGFTGATAVSFGVNAAASYTVNSDTQITATVPEIRSGNIASVTVTTPEGTSSDTAADDFAYELGGLTQIAAINCGETTSDYTDAEGLTWEQDDANSYFTGGSAAVVVESINNTADDTVFGSSRYWSAASGTYEIPVTNGTYHVQIYETEFSASKQSVGARVFDISIEGVLVEDDLDIYSKVGGYNALTLLYKDVTVADGGLTIAFGYVTDNPKVTGIRVIDATPPAAPSKTSDNTYSQITIDGNLSEFASVSATTLTESVSGTSADFKFLYDQTYLFVGVDVTDTQLNVVQVSRDATNIWHDDAVEMWFDTANDGDPISAGDYKIFISAGGIQYDAGGTGGSFAVADWNGTWQSAVVTTGTVNTASDTDTGYTIEARIPWTELGVNPPSDTDEWGFDFSIRDRADNGATQYEIWSNSDDGNTNNPDGYGTLTFSETAVKPNMKVNFILP